MAHSFRPVGREPHRPRPISRRAARTFLPGVAALSLLGASAATVSTGAGAPPAVATPIHPGAPVHAVTLSATTPSGTLVDDGSSFVQGSIVTFDYTASVADSTNWVGIYQPGQTPGVNDSTTWQYTPGTSGSVSFSTASLSPGTWVAYLFYDNEYGVMAGPVTFTVTALPPAAPATMPGYTGQEGRGVLDGPAGISLDTSGDSWVADTYGDRVVELSPRGQVERVLGDRGAREGQLDEPEAVTVDPDGQVFVADTGNNRVEEYSTTGRYLATIGGPGTGNGQFDQPEGVAVSGSTLYVADTNNNRVEEFSTATGAYTGQITQGMSDPQGLAVSDGDLWVAQNGITDTLDDSVTEYTPAGNELRSLPGSQPTGPDSGLQGDTSEFGGMSNPAAVAVDGSGDVYVTEPDYNLVQEFTGDGQYLGEFGTPSDGRAGTLDLPVGVAAEPDGQVLVADSGNDRIASYGPVGSTHTKSAKPQEPRRQSSASPLRVFGKAQR